MSRVAKIRGCASACERRYGPRSQSSYNECFSECSSTRPSRSAKAHVAKIEYMQPTAKAHRAQVTQSPEMHRISYESHRMPMAQRAQIQHAEIEPSFIGMATGAARSIANLFKYGANGKGIAGRRLTKSTRGVKGAKGAKGKRVATKKTPTIKKRTPAKKAPATRKRAAPAPKKAPARKVRKTSKVLVRKSSGRKLKRGESF